MGVVNTMYRKHHKTPGVGGVFGDRWGAGGNASLPLRGIEHLVAVPVSARRYKLASGKGRRTLPKHVRRPYELPHRIEVPVSASFAIFRSQEDFLTRCYESYGFFHTGWL